MGDSIGHLPPEVIPSGNRVSLFHFYHADGSTAAWVCEELARKPSLTIPRGWFPYAVVIPELWWNQWEQCEAWLKSRTTAPWIVWMGPAHDRSPRMSILFRDNCDAVHFKLASLGRPPPT